MHYCSDCQEASPYESCVLCGCDLTDKEDVTCLECGVEIDSSTGESLCFECGDLAYERHQRSVEDNEDSDGIGF